MQPSDEITMDKEYRTRDGQEVRLYALDGKGPWSVHGAIRLLRNGVGVWEFRNWHPNGAQHWKVASNDDLIEKKKTYKKTLWMNIYPTGLPTTYDSRTAADTCANDHHRVACTKVVIEVEKGEGLGTTEEG